MYSVRIELEITEAAALLSSSLISNGGRWQQRQQGGSWIREAEAWVLGAAAATLITTASAKNIPATNILHPLAAELQMTLWSSTPTPPQMNLLKKQLKLLLRSRAGECTWAPLCSPARNCTSRFFLCYDCPSDLWHGFTQPSLHITLHTVNPNWYIESLHETICMKWTLQQEVSLKIFLFCKLL